LQIALDSCLASHFGTLTLRFGDVRLDGTRGSPDNLANLEVHEPLVVTRNGGFEAHAEPSSLSLGRRFAALALSSGRRRKVEQVLIVSC
jgi:hypothetical protein